MIMLTLLLKHCVCMNVVAEWYWSLIAGAIFSLIDALLYFTHPGHLRSSQEKLKQQAYVSPEDFAYDFSQLFGNVTTYYPESHAAHSKAHELAALFDARWREAQAKFR